MSSSRLKDDEESTEEEQDEDDGLFSVTSNAYAVKASKRIRSSFLALNSNQLKLLPSEPIKPNSWIIGVTDKAVTLISSFITAFS